MLVHCAGGIDRTELVCALLLRLAGVGIDAIAEDYAASEANWAPTVEQWIAEAPDDAERRKRRLLAVMPPQAMHDVLVELEREYDDTEAYLRAGGASEAALARARALLRG